MPSVGANIQSMVPTKMRNTTDLFHQLKWYCPSDHTKSLKMRAHVSPPTSFVQHPGGSSAVGSAATGLYQNDNH